MVAERFEVPGRLVEMGPMGCGNVNDTYLAVFRSARSESRVVVQRINTRVFRRPDWIMSNLRVLADHVHGRIVRESRRADRAWRFPRVIPCRNGRDYYRDRAGECWRAMTLIPSATSFERVQGVAHAREAGVVLGQFHRLVSDLDAVKLRVVLPGFHQTPSYLSRYDKTVRGGDGARRMKSHAGARDLGAFVEARRSLVDVLESARRRGELAPRTIHGDPKVSNIMIDVATGKGTSIVDLDTVQAGLIHYDFGDALRSLANPAGEEASPLARIHFDKRLCEAFIKGYMTRARDFLTAADRHYLYDSIRLIAFELGLRFLEDYLAGNIYFKVRSAGHNLRRAGVQFRLCESIEAGERDIRGIIERCAR